MVWVRHCLFIALVTPNSNLIPIVTGAYTAGRLHTRAPPLRLVCTGLNFWLPSGVQESLGSSNCLLSVSSGPSLQLTSVIMEEQAGPSSAPAIKGSSSGSTLHKSQPSSASRLSTQDLRRRYTTISAADHLYLRLPTGSIRYIKPRALDPTSVASTSGPGSRKHKIAVRNLRSTNVASLGRFGNFDLDDLEGVPYGWTWEIGPPKQSANETNREQNLQPAGTTTGEADSPMPEAGSNEAENKAADGAKAKGKTKKNKSTTTSEPPGALRIMVGSTLAELEETNATNEDIYDDPQATPGLTMVDVQALKDSGLEGQDLIDEMLKSSSSFGKRTVYSQEKIIERKKSKYMRLFTPLVPSLSTLVDYYHENKSADRIAGLRADALSQLLSFGNVGAGGRYIVVDGTNGLLTAACLERLGGEGRVLAIHDAESPPEYDIMRSMNLPPKSIDDVLRVLHWGQVAADYEPPHVPDIPPLLDASDPSVPNRNTPEGSKLYRNRERERHRILKRHQAVDEVEAIRQELFAGDYDGLLVASPYEPVSIIETLMPYLAGSAALAIHSPHLQPIAEAHARLRGNNKVINVSITEPWMRRYQVLPGRTHPEMSTNATAGYILHGIRVYTESEAAEVVEVEKQRSAANQDVASTNASTDERAITKRDADVLQQTEEVEASASGGIDSDIPAQKRTKLE